MASLLALPNELLQRIAGFLTYPAFAELKLVNHRLHDICNDRLVLSHIARYGFENTPGAARHLLQLYSADNRIDLGPHQLHWAQGDRCLSDASFDNANHMALAVSRCIEASFAEDGNWTIRTTTGGDHYDFIKWLPHLLALQHPATLGLDPSMLLRVHHSTFTPPRVGPRRNFLRDLLAGQSTRAPSSPSRADMTDFAVTSFALTYLTLQRLETTCNNLEVVRIFEDYFFPQKPFVTTEYAHTAEFDLIENTLKHFIERVPDYGTNTGTFTRTQAFAVSIPMIIGLAVQRRGTHDRGNFPKPSKLPLYDYMDVPPVYAGHAAEQFAICHISKMVKPEFLSGRWWGYYSDERSRRKKKYNHFDGPMCDIRLFAGPPSTPAAPLEHEATAPSVSACIDRRSRGVDQHDEFTLEGEIFDDGTVSMTKRYINAGWTWQWTGQVTPFGIIGIWGSRGHFGGHFWIWKDEWI